MSALRAWWDGLWRECYAPFILVGMWLLTVAVGLPLALALRGMIADHLGASLAAHTAVTGVNWDWWQEFSDQATGLGVTFKPNIIGFAAVIDNANDWLDNWHRPVVIAGAASAYVVLWIFFAGGIIDRYARNRPTRAQGFFAACGVFFFRFLRLAIVAWMVYGALFAWLHPYLLEDLFPRVTRDLTVERTAFEIRAGLYGGFLLILAACNMIFDYAKIRAVVEDRRSMLGAIRAAIGFVARNFGAAAGVYLLNVLLLAFVVALYALVAPGAGGGSGWSIWGGLAIGQIYIMARIWVKLVFWSSQTSLFQGRMAHAGYVAARAPTWPESPAAEAVMRSG
jgi:hypothetical protein